MRRIILIVTLLLVIGCKERVVNVETKNPLPKKVSILFEYNERIKKMILLDTLSLECFGKLRQAYESSSETDLSNKKEYFCAIVEYEANKDTIYISDRTINYNGVTIRDTTTAAFIINEIIRRDKKMGKKLETHYYDGRLHRVSKQGRQEHEEIKKKLPESYWKSIEQHNLIEAMDIIRASFTDSLIVEYVVLMDFFSEPSSSLSDYAFFFNYIQGHRTEEYGEGILSNIANVFIKYPEKFYEMEKHLNSLPKELRDEIFEKFIQTITYGVFFLYNEAIDSRTFGKLYPYLNKPEIIEKYIYWYNGIGEYYIE